MEYQYMENVHWMAKPGMHGVPTYGKITLGCKKRVSTWKPIGLYKQLNTWSIKIWTNGMGLQNTEYSKSLLLFIIVQLQLSKKNFTQDCQSLKITIRVSVKPMLLDDNISYLDGHI